jgi:protein-disulfide isomerase
MTPRRRLAVVAALALAVVAAAVIISPSPPHAETHATAVAPSLFDGIEQDGIALGSPDAPYTLIEFADLQCPFCAAYAAETLPTVIDRFVRSGHLRLELRLVRFIGPDSERGAEVAAAATLQNRVWEFSELFFRNQGPENSGYATDEFLRRLARATPGLDVDRVSRDLDSPPARPLIEQADRMSNRLGVEGTPSFFLRRGGGRPQPLEVSSLDADSFVSQVEATIGQD